MFGNGKCFPADGKVPCANRYAYTVAYAFHALYCMYVDCFANGCYWSRLVGHRPTGKTYTIGCYYCVPFITARNDGNTILLAVIIYLFIYYLLLSGFEVPPRSPLTVNL